MREGDNKVVAKIEKLLRLGESTNIHEAAAAMARVQEMMDRHNISMADVADHAEERDDPIDDHGELMDFGQRLSKWKVRLALTLGIHNHCKIYLEHYTRRPSKEKVERKISKGKRVRLSEKCTRLNVIGRKSDVQVFRYMQMFLEKELTRLYKEDIGWMGMGAQVKNNWLMGAVDTVDDRLREARLALKRALTGQVSERALVKFENRGQETNDWVAKNKSFHSTKQGRMRTRDQDAYDLGRIAGEQVNLSDSRAGSLTPGAKRLKG